MNNLNYDPINKTVGAGIPFQRIRRITGYLVGDLSRFNNAKLAEVKDREKHMKRRKQNETYHNNNANAHFSF